MRALGISRLTISALVVACIPHAWPQPKITAVANAASFQSGLPSGGSLATLFCSGLGNVKTGTYLAPSLPLPYTLGGLTVAINGVPAPLLAAVVTQSGQAASAQINFQVPLERNVSLFDQYTGLLEACGTVLTLHPTHDSGDPATVYPPTWGGFFGDTNRYAVAQHGSDFSQVTPQNPAHPGETVVAYGDDFFPVWPPPPLGFPTPSQPLFQLTLVPTYPLPFAPLFIGGGSDAYLYLQDYPVPCNFPSQQPCSFTNTPALSVTFEGLAPGQIGVEQINFVIPASQGAGDWALFFNHGSCPDGNPTPFRCGLNGSSGPYVKLPVR